jgi:hypothetical protein
MDCTNAGVAALVRRTGHQRAKRGAVHLGVGVVIEDDVRMRAGLLDQRQQPPPQGRFARAEISGDVDEGRHRGSEVVRERPL